MVLNASKMGAYKRCTKYAFWKFHQGLSKESIGMRQGTAFHQGVATGMATRNWDLAKEVASSTFKDSMKDSFLLPEEETLSPEYEDIVLKSIDLYRENWETLGYRIIQPEVKFEVDIPSSHHNCIFIHWIEDGVEKWNHTSIGCTFSCESCGFKRDPWDQRKDGWIPSTCPSCGSPSITKTIHGLSPTLEFRGDRMSPEAILKGNITSPHSSPTKHCLCYQPHKLRGITDALVMVGSSLWFLEHKTTSRADPNFWSDFTLDLSITAYSYGIWKSMGIMPRGAILNAIVKPSHRMVSSWNRKRSVDLKRSVSDYLEFHRDSLAREEADLLDFEREVRLLGNEWEGRILSGYFPMSNTRGICTLFYHPCEYHGICLTRGDPDQIASFYVPEEETEEEK